MAGRECRIADSVEIPSVLEWDHLSLSLTATVGVLAGVGGEETEREADAVCSGAREVLLSLLGTAEGRVWWDLATAGHAGVE